MSETVSRSPFIELTGCSVGQRFELKLHGRPVLLSGTSFFYLFQLAFHATINPGCWFEKEKIEDTDNQAKYIYRLRRELDANNVSSFPLIENNRHGCYRLSVKAGRFGMNLESLFQHPDARVRDNARLLESTSSSVNSIALAVNAP